MKKLLLAVMVLVASATATKAQFYIGGSLGFWSNSWHYSRGITSFNIAPDAGYSFNDRWAVGLAVGFDMDIYQKNHPYYPNNRYYFYAEPYARFNYFSTDRIKLFLDGVVGISLNHNGLEGFQVIIRPGIAINLTDHFSLDGTFGTLGFRQDYRNTNSGFGLDLTNSLEFGFYYSF